MPNSLDAINDICFSKHFKRLADKTQMIDTRVSEHYRTRLTHTLEVMSIANTICDKLNDIFDKEYFDLKIDKNIVLATALAHDLGHTPYGHVGEQIIRELLKDTGYLFKHNVNSIKIMLEKKQRPTRNPLEIFPHNIDWQIIDGVLKHTKVFPKDYEKKLDDPYELDVYFENHPVYTNSDFKSFINSYLNKDSNSTFLKTYLEYPHPLTLSGQIIAVADEIAQRISDFDDTIRLLKKRNIKRIASTDIFKDLVKRINEVYEEFERIEEFKKTKTCKSTINYCEHILKLLKEAKKNDELSFVNIINRTKNFYIENLIEGVKDKISMGIKYEVLEINYKLKDMPNIEKKVKYYLIKSTNENQFIYFDKFVEKIRKTMSEFSYKNVHNSKEIEKGNSLGKEYIKKWFDYNIKDFNLCDNKVKRYLIELLIDTYGDECNECDITAALEKFNESDNLQYINKCKLIILEGISYMSNNYLANKITEYEKKYGEKNNMCIDTN